MIGEIAVATVLLFGAGLMVHTMVRLPRVNPCFDPDNLQTFSFSLAGPARSGPEGDAKKQAFLDGAIQRLRACVSKVTYMVPKSARRGREY
jgi:putative ABC transport system permease protein